MASLDLAGQRMAASKSLISLWVRVFTTMQVLVARTWWASASRNQILS